MNHVFRALFIEQGTAIIAISNDSISKYSLSQNDQGDLAPSRLWEIQIEYCANVVEAPKAGRLIASDTSGRHFGLCRETGSVLWKSKPVGEGDPGCIVEHRTDGASPHEEFVFVTWSGLLQRLDPKGGQEIERPTKFVSQFRGLQFASQSQKLFLTCLIPAKSKADPMGETLNLLDLKSAKVREVTAETFSVGISVSPTGNRALFFYLSKDESTSMTGALERWEIKDIESGKTISERTFPSQEIMRFNTIWSPDEKYIATSDNSGHLILSAETLRTLVTIEGKYPKLPSFHPSGTHICLCRAEDTCIVPIQRFLSD